MAASSDHFKKLSRRWVGQIGSSGVPDGITTTVPFSSVTNLATDTAVVATIGRVDANGTPTPDKEETVIGVVSGSNLSNCIRGAEGTAQAHNSGDVVEILVTAKGWNDLIDGLLVSFKQDGTPNFIDTDGTLANNSDSLVPSEKAVRTYITNNVIAADGWTSESHTWTYVSTDGHTFVVSVSADLTAIIQAGDKVKFTNNSTTFYGFVSKTPTVSAGVTTVTLYGGQNYTVANSAINAPFYSHHKSPFGFNTDPTIWAEKLTDTNNLAQASPVSGTWYNPGSLNLAIPIGKWNLEYSAALRANSGGTGEDVSATLSTANNSESDTELTTFINSLTNIDKAITVYKHKYISLASKTTYFFNIKTVNTTTSINIYGNQSKTIINAFCAYL